MLAGLKLPIVSLCFVAAATAFVLGSVIKPVGSNATRIVRSPHPSPVFVTTPAVDPRDAFDTVGYYDGDDNLVHVTHCPVADPRRRHGDCADPGRGIGRHHALTMDIFYRGMEEGAGG
jgi:hypothetical protein